MCEARVMRLAAVSSPRHRRELPRFYINGLVVLDVGSAEDVRSTRNAPCSSQQPWGLPRFYINGLVVLDVAL